jgi:hypothetical protein
MTLKELEPGDKFIHAKATGTFPKKFLVKGSCMFNRGHGSSTRQCVDLQTGNIIGKSCRLEVKKIGESIHKQKMLGK